MTPQEQQIVTEMFNNLRKEIDDLKHQNQILTARVEKAELGAISVNPMYPEEERVAAAQKLNSILLEEKAREESRKNLEGQFIM